MGWNDEMLADAMTTDKRKSPRRNNATKVEQTTDGQDTSREEEKSMGGIRQ